MKNDLLDSVKQTVKYWWVSLLIGALAIILGIWCIAAPGTTIAVLSALFVATFLVSGLFEIFYAISNRDHLNGWGWSLVSGIVSVIFAILLIALPFESIFVFIFFIGFWIMFQSFWGIGVSIDLQKSGVKGWGWILALAILGILLATLLIINPAFATGFIVAIFSITLICYGILRIYYAMKLKNIYNKIDDMK